MKRFGYRMGFRALPFILAGIALVSTIVMLLWNALIPVIFHVAAINFWQALGLLILSKILFGGFRGPWGRRGNPEWRKNMEAMKEKWMNMTPEQREEFKQKMKNRCGGRFTRFDEATPEAKTES